MEPDDDLRTLIGERAREIDVPAPNPRAVRIRARRFRVRRYATGGSLALLLAVGVVVPLRALGALGGRGPARVVSESPVPGQLPDAAKILCDGSTTQLLTPEVRPQPDGVHFEVENSSGRALGFQVRNGGGSDAPAGTSEPADPGTGSPGWAIAPGAASVRCIDYDVQDPGDPQGYVAVAITDESGVWVPDTLECSGSREFITSPFYADRSHGPKGDLVDVARDALSGYLQQGDEVRRAGYPEAAQPEVIVVRDGRVVLVAPFLRTDDGGWLEESVNGCSE
jgi:hypothetical protein